MPTSEMIEELMLRWEAARQVGKRLTPEDLCADSPQLLDQLQQQIRAVQVMERVLGFEDHLPGRTTPATAPAASLDADGELLPQVPGYEILRLVDQGGMGVVYEARQTDLGRTVAIKMISSFRLAPTLVARFRAEAEASARLQHPNFVQVFEVGQVNGRPYFSMEYVAGGSLAQHLAHTPPSARQAAELVETLARAVQAAHERGIVHRDLKPSNVMLTTEGVLKIADFGLAKRLDDNPGHTRTGEVLGTPSYMAPEQAEGRKDLIGVATDVYALGAILYDCLTGSPPFKGATTLDTIRQVVSQDPVAPSRLARALPADLEAICLKCLEKTPGSRYRTARELAEDLRRFLNGQPVTARRTGALRRGWKWVRRHPLGAALAFALGVLAILPLLVLWGQHRARRELVLQAERQAPLVREILNRHCFECHGGKDVEKNLNILDHQLLLNKTRRLVVPGEPGDSRLIQRIADGSMPPEEEEEHLPRVSEQELAILRDWVRGGAPPLPPEDPRRPTPPVVPYSALAAKVKALFQQKCYRCHKFKEAKGGIKILDYRLLVTVRKVVVPGQPDESELLQLLTLPDNEKLRMPPIPDKRLSEEEINTIRQWIQEGATPFPRIE